MGLRLLCYKLIQENVGMFGNIYFLGYVLGDTATDQCKDHLYKGKAGKRYNV